MDHKQSSAEYRRRIDIIQQECRNLTMWEEDFVESMRQRLDERYSLTEAQAEKIEQIWDAQVPQQFK